MVVAEWLMSDRSPRPIHGRRWRAFPHARCLAAFDGAVAASGYGLFHELVASGVPTLFVPNEHPEADNQLARARWAEEGASGLSTRSRASACCRRGSTRLLQPSRQEAMRASLALATAATGQRRQPRSWPRWPEGPRRGPAGA